MTDFGYHCKAKWDAGQSPKTEGATHTVRDESCVTTYAYSIEPADYDEFVSWVAGTFPGDNDWQEEGETDENFLDRIGIRINEVLEVD